MKTRHLTAAVALAVVLCVPVAASASDRDKPGHHPGGIARIIQKLQKILGVSTNSDIPIPPHPGPKP